MHHCLLSTQIAYEMQLLSSGLGDQQVLLCAKYDSIEGHCWQWHECDAHSGINSLDMTAQIWHLMCNMFGHVRCQKGCIGQRSCKAVWMSNHICLSHRLLMLCCTVNQLNAQGGNTLQMGNCCVDYWEAVMKHVTGPPLGLGG